MISPVQIAPALRMAEAAALKIPLLAENPTTPFVTLKLRRREKRGVGGEEVLEIRPTRFEYYSSVMDLDMLEVTCFDPEFTLIDHPLLIEDLQTYATITFGYEGGPEIEEPVELVFFRQRPLFGESGALTTLTFYDRGVFLALPRGSHVLRSKDGITVKDYLKKVVEVINGDWDADLQLDTGDLVFSDKRFEYKKPVNESFFRFLWYLRNTQTVLDKDTPPEIFVRNHTLYFRPRRRRVYPIAIYRYFSEVPGAQLLSFEPEVHLRPQWERSAGVDTDEGDTELAHAATDGVAPTPVAFSSQMRGVNVETLSETRGVDPARRTSVITRPTPAPLEPVGAETQAKLNPVSHPVQQGETLASIAELYQISADELATANGITNLQQYTLPPTLSVPRRAETNKAPREKTQKQSFYEYLDAEDHAVRATARVIGQPNLEAGWPILLENVGKRWSGLWYLVEVRHVVTNDGYVCDLDLARDGVPLDVKGYSDKDTTAEDGLPEVKSPAEQKKEAKKTQAMRGVDEETLREIRKPGTGGG